MSTIQQEHFCITYTSGPWILWFPSQDLFFYVHEMWLHIHTHIQYGTDPSSYIDCMTSMYFTDFSMIFFHFIFPFHDSMFGLMVLFKVSQAMPDFLPLKF